MSFLPLANSWRINLIHTPEQATLNTVGHGLLDQMGDWLAWIRTRTRTSMLRAYGPRNSKTNAHPCYNAETEATEKCYAKEASHKEGRRTRQAFSTAQPSPAFSCKNKGALCSGHLHSEFSELELNLGLDSLTCPYESTFASPCTWQELGFM